MRRKPSQQDGGREAMSQTYSSEARPGLRERSRPAERASGLPASASPPLAADLPAEHAVDLQIQRDLSAIAIEWKAFEHHADGTAFQACEWLAKWQRHIGARHGTTPAIVLGRDPGGHPLLLL